MNTVKVNYNEFKQFYYPQHEQTEKAFCYETKRFVTMRMLNDQCFCLQTTLLSL